jgi:hypothetical protein
MQKVVGSSPIIRFATRRKRRVFHACIAGDPTGERLIVSLKSALPQTAAEIPTTSATA